MNDDTQAVSLNGVKDDKANADTSNLYGVSAEEASAVESILAGTNWSDTVKRKAKLEGDETYHNVEVSEKDRFVRIEKQRGVYDANSPLKQRTIINKARAVASRRRKQKMNAVILSSLQEPDRVMRQMAATIVRLSTELSEVKLANVDQRTGLPALDAFGDTVAASAVAPVHRGCPDESVDNFIDALQEENANSSVDLAQYGPQAIPQVPETMSDYVRLSMVNSACDLACALDYPSWDSTCTPLETDRLTLDITPSFEEDVRCSHDSDSFQFDHYPSAAWLTEPRLTRYERNVALMFKESTRFVYLPMSIEKDKGGYYRSQTTRLWRMFV